MAIRIVTNPSDDMPGGQMDVRKRSAANRRVLIFGLRGSRGNVAFVAGPNQRALRRVVSEHIQPDMFIDSDDRMTLLQRLKSSTNAIGLPRRWRMSASRGELIVLAEGIARALR